VVAKVKIGASGKTVEVTTKAKPPKLIAKEPPAAGFINAREVAVLAAPLIQAASKEIGRERRARLAEPEPEREGGGPVWLWFAGGLLLGGAAMVAVGYLQQMRARRAAPIEIPEIPIHHRVSYTTYPVHPE
jgi:hypothetical protein